MIRRPPRSTQSRSSAASDVYKRQLETQGTPRASAWSATGLTVSGVEATIITSTPSLVMRSPATVAARFESDCESFMMNSIECVCPSPHLRPSLTEVFQCSTQKPSVSPNPASGPVSGETNPTLIVRPPPLLPPELLLPQAASTLPPPATPSAAPATPATLRKSRRVTGVLPIPAPSDASLDLRSSELMPPPCFGSAVTGDSTSSRTDRRELPLGPCWTRAAAHLGARGKPVPTTRTPQPGQILSLWCACTSDAIHHTDIPPTIRASYSRRHRCQALMPRAPSSAWLTFEQRMKVAHCLLYTSPSPRD